MSRRVMLLTLAALAAVGHAWSGALADPPGQTRYPARPAQDGALSLVLNLPAFRLDVRSGARTVRSYRVAIGTRRYRTPLGRFGVSSVELNPWWYPPDSEWARRERVTPPGPGNPMGRAKLNFHELYFLHGTPLEESLGSAASHGCVRMASRDALELARLVLGAARPDVSAAEIDAAERSRRRTRRYALFAPVPLTIEYRTAEVRGDTLELHPDVYRRERATLRTRALEALRQAGVAEERIDPRELDATVRAGRREHVRVALQEILLPPGALPAGDATPEPSPVQRTP